MSELICFQNGGKVMIYKQFKDIQLSALGMGTMRFPLLNDGSGKIDEVRTAEMFDYAMKNGINYYDTAWGYHEEQSEVVTGKILNKYPRESYYLATKFPGYDKKHIGRVAEVFEKQLEKTGMEYFDFYLFHCVDDKNIDDYLNPEYGIMEYLLEQKKNGRIKYLGFSTHGSLETMTRFLEAYGNEMEFCQIQLNYIDWFFQQAKEKIDLLKQYNLPIWVMEPVRGGKLANIDANYEARLKELRPEENTPAWAFRFLQSIPEVTMILSGMSNMEQVEDNVRTFSTEAPLNEKEWDTILDIANGMCERLSQSLPCTNCRYCVTKCPMELSIPELLPIYNEDIFTGGTISLEDKLSKFPADKRPNACISCRSCEAVCPQNIKISEAMQSMAAKMK